MVHAFDPNIWGAEDGELLPEWGQLWPRSETLSWTNKTKVNVLKNLSALWSKVRCPDSGEWVLNVGAICSWASGVLLLELQLLLVFFSQAALPPRENPLASRHVLLARGLLFLEHVFRGKSLSCSGAGAQQRSTSHRNNSSPGFLCRPKNVCKSSL